MYLYYEILDANRGYYNSNNIIDILPVRNLYTMDTFNFVVDNYPGGYIFTDNLTLRIGLAQYLDTATDAYLPFSVTYRTCRPDVFAILPVEDRVYYVG